MRRVNVDRMRRHQRRGRDTMRLYVDDRWVDVPAEWSRDGSSVVLGPLTPRGFRVHASAEQVAEMMRANGRTFPPAPHPVPRLAAEQKLRRT